MVMLRRRRAGRSGLHGVAGRRLRDRADQPARAIDLLAVDRRDRVARAQARMRRRTRAIHAGHRHAGGMSVWAGVLHRHAEPATSMWPRRVAGLRSAGDLARDREADADRAAGGGDDSGVHRDHLSVHVEGGATGVARIDGGVKLQEIVERTGAEIAPSRRDDARGHRTAQSERIAGREHPVADLHACANRPTRPPAADAAHPP